MYKHSEPDLGYKHGEEILLDLHREAVKYYLKTGKKDRLKDIYMDKSATIVFEQNDIKKTYKISYPRCLWKEYSGYYIQKELGHGSFGSVNLACLDGKCTYAVKIVLPDYDEDDKEDMETWEHNFNQELEITKKMGDLEIGPKCYGGWICRPENFGVIILEKYDMSLMDYLDKYGDEVNNTGGQVWTQLKMTFSKLNNLVARTHRAGYYHLDLHEGNVLLKVYGKMITDVRINDWGLSWSIKGSKEAIAEGKSSGDHFIDQLAWDFNERSSDSAENFGSDTFESFLEGLRSYRGSVDEMIDNHPGLVDYMDLFYWNMFLGNSPGEEINKLL